MRVFEGDKYVDGNFYRLSDCYMAGFDCLLSRSPRYIFHVDRRKDSSGAVVNDINRVNCHDPIVAALMQYLGFKMRDECGG